MFNSICKFFDLGFNILCINFFLLIFLDLDLDVSGLGLV